MQNFCYVKDTTKSMKRQATDWNQILANHISDQKLVYGIYEELSKFNKKKMDFFFFFKEQIFEQRLH